MVSGQEGNTDDEMNVAWKSASVSVMKVFVERFASLLFNNGRKGCLDVVHSSTEDVVVSVELEGMIGGLFAL